MSVRYLEIEGASPGEYYFLILCATLGMMVMAAGIDLITIFIGLETMAVSFYILAGFIKPNQRSNEAAVKYFLLGAFTLGILLYGMSLMYGLSNTTALRAMAPVFVGQERDPRLVLAVILGEGGRRERRQVDRLGPRRAEQRHANNRGPSRRDGLLAHVFRDGRQLDARDDLPEGIQRHGPGK